MNIKMYTLNKNLNGRKAGEIISLKCDERGVVLDAYWRRRIADSVKDNCISPYSVSKSDGQKNKSSNDKKGK